MLTIYKASAGSGKTFTLALQYIRMLVGVKLEDGTYRLNAPKYTGGRHLAHRHRHILAITFTNKATEEMKARIVGELGMLAADHSDGSKDSMYAPKLIAEFGCTRQELGEVAGRALRELLFDYHHFNVSTIDSFFQTVLRSFAREVDRQGDYGLELSDELAVSAGIGMMLDDLNYGNPPRRREMMHWISRYTMNLVESGLDGSMFNRSGSLLRDLTKYVTKMGSEVFKREADRVLEYLDDPSKIKKFTKAIDERIVVLKKTMRNEAAAVLNDLASLGFDQQVMPAALLQIIMDVVEDKETGTKKLDLACVQKVLAWRTSGSNDFYVKKYCPGTSTKKVFPPDSFSDEICDWVDLWRRSIIEIHALKHIKDACPNLEFLGFTWHYINRFREENNLILLSDTNDLLKKIIGDSDTPFVYERIGVTLRHFLIDEFQDTSHMQWHNLKPLVADSIASDNDNLIIGDEKQAIYRFRNSDSSLLHHVVAEDDFPNDHQIRGNCGEDNTNHRSASGIVRFNNALFTRMARDNDVAGYENTVQAVSDNFKDLQAYIRIFDTKGLPKVNDMPAEFDITAREILRQHAVGYKWKDIAVLVRLRKEAEAVVNYLLKNYPQIKVLSDEALLLKNSPAVKLVISMLKLVDESYSAITDSTRTDGAEKPVYASVGDIRMMISRYEYFAAEGYGPSEALSLALSPTPDGTHAAILDSIVDIRRSHPVGLVSLVETIIAKKVPEARRRQEYAYLAAFQDEVIKYSQTYNGSVHSFLDWWDEMSDKLAITSGSGQDAVTVMTVHKAKGLQWPCVHVPFGDWDLVKSSESMWIRPDTLDFVDPEVVPPLISVEVDRLCGSDGSPLKSFADRSRYEQLTDNLNVTYVAYTRAERELNICFPKRTAAGSAVISALTQSQSDSEDGELCMDLAAYLQSDDDQSTGIIFEYGEPTVPVNTDKEKAEDTVAREFPDYKVCFREDLAALTTIDDATAEVGDIMTQDDPVEEIPAGDQPDDNFDEIRAMAAERGTHLHSIMADLDTPADLDAVISRAALRYGLSTSEEMEYYTIIHNAFEQAVSHVERWFSHEATVYKEQSIYKPEGDSTYRPDRIVIGSDGSAEVVDYKFTYEPLPSHVSQVEQYNMLLRAMGYEKVTGYLWYPELNIIKTVK